jgi:hypothetical protein
VQLLPRSSGLANRRWQPSPRSWRPAACGPLLVAQHGNLSKARGCWPSFPLIRKGLGPFWALWAPLPLLLQSLQLLQLERRRLSKGDHGNCPRPDKGVSESGKDGNHPQHGLRCHFLPAALGIPSRFNAFASPRWETKPAAMSLKTVGSKATARASVFRRFSNALLRDALFSPTCSIERSWPVLDVTS